MQIYFNTPRLCSFTKGANISGGHCIPLISGEELEIVKRWKRT